MVAEGDRGRSVITMSLTHCCCINAQAECCEAPVDLRYLSSTVVAGLGRATAVASRGVCTFVSSGYVRVALIVRLMMAPRKLDVCGRK